MRAVPRANRKTQGPKKSSRNGYTILVALIQWEATTADTLDPAPHTQNSRFSRDPCQ